MNNYNELNNMSLNDLADWLDNFTEYEGTPWCNWFQCTFCDKCESVMTFVPFLNREAEASYCEINHHCRFFDKYKDVPSTKEIIRLWLLEEASDDGESGEN